jgi:alkylation response protein AidB-like acyl-CoA dehydrogenase
MYSFEPSEEQKMLIDAIRRYTIADLRVKAHDADEEANLPFDLIEKGWELGILQASIPEVYGGFGDYSAVTGVLAAEELAWGDMAGALSVLTPNLYVLPILFAGSEKQKENLIPTVIEAEWKPFTAGLIEPHFDFDPNDLTTYAKEDGTDYIINGEKIYVPYAENYEGMIIYAKLGDKTQGFVIPKGTEGVEVVERNKTLGIYALPLYSVKLNDVRVPKENLLGNEDDNNFSRILASQHIALASIGIGLAKAAFEYSRDYAKDREVFGVKVAQKQAIAFMLAEMLTEIESIRLLLWEAAWKLDNNRDGAEREAYLALNGVIDMAMMVSDRAVQILGGHGFIREHPVEMWMRNGRGIAMLNGLVAV